MSGPEPLTPDGGEVLRLWLRSEAELIPLVGTRIALSLTGDLPAIRYALVTGSSNSVGAGVGIPKYQVECWGAGSQPDDGKSLLIARTVVRLVPNFVGTFNGAKVSGASARYPYSQPDPTTGRARHIVEVTFIASP